MKYFLTPGGFEDITINKDDLLLKILRDGTVLKKNVQTPDLTKAILSPYIYFKPADIKQYEYSKIEPALEVSQYGAFMYETIASAAENNYSTDGYYLLLHDIYWHEHGYRMRCSFLESGAVDAMFRKNIIDEIISNL